jgi:peroxiredoxin
MTHHRKMFVRFFSLGILLFVVLFSSAASVYGSDYISQGKNLPAFTLNARDDPGAKQYLGLKTPTSFTLSQIPARFVIIEFFSLYCPICHKQAPVANKIYKVIQRDPELSKNIKMIGIGTGNNQREVEAFKTNLRVPFPLFTDLDFKIHKKIGEPRTPFTILVTNKGKILLTHSGVVEDVDDFVARIRKVLGQ